MISVSGSVPLSPPPPPRQQNVRMTVKTSTTDDSDESDDDAAFRDDSERLWKFDLPQVGKCVHDLGKIIPIHVANMT